MSDRPILFSAPMIKALLAGRKTQTRRILKVQPVPFKLDDGSWCEVAAEHTEGEIRPRIRLGRVITRQTIPYAVGDRLWVRETVRAEELVVDANDGVRYLADEAFIRISDSFEAAYRWVDLHGYRGKRGATVPPIHMPRWASRLTLTVTDVRVQLLQEISEEDAIAEGWPPPVDPVGGGPINWFARLWNEINGPQAWHDNPFVACYSFEVSKGNIDA